MKALNSIHYTVGISLILLGLGLVLSHPSSGVVKTTPAPTRDDHEYFLGFSNGIRAATEFIVSRQTNSASDWHTNQEATAIAMRWYTNR